MRITNINTLSRWFGGSATVKHNKSRQEYIILIKNDDLINEFFFWFTESQYLQLGEKQLTIWLLDKYLKSMEIEQQLIKKRLLKNDKSGEDIRVCS